MEMHASRLLAVSQQQAAGKRHRISQETADTLTAFAEAADHAAHSQVSVVFHDDQGADQRQPHEHEAGNFFRKYNPGIEAITQNHIAKHQDCHDAEHADQHPFNQPDQNIQKLHFELPS